MDSVRRQLCVLLFTCAWLPTSILAGTHIGNPGKTGSANTGLVLENSPEVFFENVSTDDAEIFIARDAASKEVLATMERQPYSSETSIPPSLHDAFGQFSQNLPSVRGFYYQKSTNRQYQLLTPYRYQYKINAQGKFGEKRLESILKQVHFAAYFTDINLEVTQSPLAPTIISFKLGWLQGQPYFYQDDCPRPNCSSKITLSAEEALSAQLGFMRYEQNEQSDGAAAWLSLPIEHRSNAISSICLHPQTLATLLKKGTFNVSADKLPATKICFADKSQFTDMILPAKPENISLRGGIRSFPTTDGSRKVSVREVIASEFVSIGSLSIRLLANTAVIKGAP